MIFALFVIDFPLFLVATSSVSEKSLQKETVLDKQENYLISAITNVREMSLAPEPSSVLLTFNVPRGFFYNSRH